ncbi:MAG: stage V sporulation protein AA [Peptostreptococcaceae bacterium]
MKDIYLMPKKQNKFKSSKKNLYIKDIYEVYPSEFEEQINNILVRRYDEIKEYDVIHLGEVIEIINQKTKAFNITFLVVDDLIVFFDDENKDHTKYLRVFITSLVVFIGSIMGIMNFHADVNMSESQFNMVNAISNNPKEHLPYFQVSYTIGIGVGVSLFFNKFIPNYSKDEPSPLDLKMKSLTKEMENQLKRK